jgi:hypothetical protein
MSPVIPLPANFVASTTAFIGQIFTDLGPYITLVIAVLLGLLVIEILINAFRK